MTAVPSHGVVQQSHQSQLSQLSQQMSTEANKATALSNCPTDPVNEEVERAIQMTLPHSWSDCISMKDRAEFQLARELKGIPQISDAPVTALRPVVERWHARARAVMKGKPFEESWLDFARAWKNVVFPAGFGPMDVAFDRAQTNPPPQGTRQFEQPGVNLLAALCRELQGLARDGPFFLSCRTASRLLSVEHTTAWRWLRVLELDGLIRQTEAGTKIKAARYRYLGSHQSKEASTPKTMLD